MGLALLVVFGQGCAEGVSTDNIGSLEAPSRAPGDAPASRSPVDGGSAAGDDGADEGGAVSTQMSGAPCMMGEVLECDCGGGAMGVQSCKFDLDSPTGGSFGACEQCVEPEPDVPDAGAGVPSFDDLPEGDCSDGVQSDQETDVDCGGPDCETCLLTQGCQVNSDCFTGECFDNRCTATEAPGDGDGDGDGDSTTTEPPPEPEPAPTPPPTPRIPCPSPCVQPCVPFGILPCCRDNGTCGCTWAPGAYCL